MRKIVIMAVLAAFMAGTATAQQIKVDKNAILKKLDKSDEDLNNEKRNTKSAYWIERGKVYTEAGSAAMTGLYTNMDMKVINTMFGKPVQEGTAVVGGVQYKTLTYPNFIIYTMGEVADFWIPTLVIKEGALETAFDAYKKAYELDPKSVSKIKPGMEEVANAYKMEIEGHYRMEEYPETAEIFRKAYEVQLHPAVGVIDTLSLYNTGMFYTFASEFEKGAKYLEDAISYSYENNGDAYYFLFHCYYGLKDYAKAKEVLNAGIQKYPANNNIIESLITLYTTTDGDPKEIIPLVQASIDKDPNNPALWNGMGGIYYKLGDNEKAFEAFQKALDLDPNDTYNYLRVGSMYVEIANGMIAKINETSYTSSADYQKDLDEANAVYRRALAPLEKAHEMDPSSIDPVELLKNISFRLRDEDGMQAKFEKYNQLYNDMK